MGVPAVEELAGQFEGRRRVQPEPDALPQPEQVDEGVDGAAVAQVADDRHDGALDGLAARGELAAQRVDVEERLRRVLARAVAGVDDRDEGGVRELGDRALVGVAHRDHVAVAGDDPGRVVDRLALGHRREREAGRRQDLPAQPGERRLEAEPGARRGLEEQAREHRPVEDVARVLAASQRTQAVGEGEQPLRRIEVELAGRDEVRSLLERLGDGGLVHEKELPSARHSVGSRGRAAGHSTARARGRPNRWSGMVSPASGTLRRACGRTA